MKLKQIHIIISFLVIAITASRTSFSQQTSTKDPQSWCVNLDQDFFYPIKNEDRNYTMGVVFGYSNNYIKYATPFSLISINGFPTEKDIYSFQLGYGAFTPFDLAESLPVTNDRPYSGVLSFQFSRMIYNDNKEVAWYANYVLGVLGTNIGKTGQTAIHEAGLKHGWNDRVVPQGWHNQISNGGELTGLITLGRKKLLYNDGSVLKLNNLAELNLGYYSNVAVGLTAFIGNVPRWYAFNSNNTGFVNQGIPGKYEMEKFFLFASIRERFVLYNALLQGQFKENPYEVNAGDIKRLIFEYDLGIKYIYKCGLGISYKITGRSPEYEIDKMSGRWHYWGSLSFDKVF